MREKRHGRNDPCPCGSGLKYKKCCFEKDRARSSRARDERSAADIALSFLYAGYPEEVEAAIDGGFLGGLTDEEYDSLGTLPGDLQDELDINIAEWLLADGVLEFEDGTVPALDLVLGPDGPNLPPQGREWLLESAGRPLSLYEVRRVVPGEGFDLLDLVSPEEPEVRLQEPELAQGLREGDTFGARLVRREDAWHLSDAFYPMPPDFAHDCLNEIFTAQEEAASGAGQEEGADPAEVAGPVLIDYWLLSLLAELPEPETEEPPA